MVIYCFVEGCKSSRYKKANEDNKIFLTFFGFPKDPNLRRKWEEALINSGHTQKHVARISKYSHICSLHFTKSCIETIGLSCGRLKPNSVPTIFPNVPIGSTADINNTESSGTPSVKLESGQCEEEIETVQCKEEIYETPSKKRICYAGDIKLGEIENMSPNTLIKSMQVLKKSCDKDKMIHRLRVH
ncbi:THAP domain-containing protein 1-like [Temnothorax longispinosus]|uniref:THAP-type domain-containing protein n=1 Tax=Temnothorax longispinosus TaxID=300112 RepID=A0A4S2KNP5_9HYME|nr:hypothetical protein DBV15_09178 [Temnothorax longispinosus]